jgi:hypothetical protein
MAGKIFEIVQVKRLTGMENIISLLSSKSTDTYSMGAGSSFPGGKTAGG